MRTAQLVVGLATAFATWLILGVVAAYFNVANFAAKLPGQECDCAIAPLLGPLDIYVGVGGVQMGVWILAPALGFGFAALELWLRRPRWILDQRRFVRAARRASTLGLLGALIVIGAIVAEYSFRGLGEAGEQAPNFRIMLTDGREVDLHSFAGKPILLEFMTTWCPHCQAETQSLRQVFEAAGPKLTILSVSTGWRGDSLEAVRTMATEGAIPWLCGLDVGGGTSAYNVQAVPQFFLIDAELGVRYSQAGEVSADELLAQLAAIA